MRINGKRIFWITIAVISAYWVWDYRQKGVACTQCQSNGITATLHYQEEWRKYYLLNCYCDEPEILRKICKLAKQVSINDTDTITSYSFVQYPFRPTEGSEIEDWDEINWNNAVAGFSFYKANRKLLDGVGFKQTKEINAKNFFVKDSVYNSRNDTINVTYKASYDKINGSILNTFIKRVILNELYKKVRICRYDLYNVNTKRVESSIQYEDYGKGFYFDIW